MACVRRSRGSRARSRMQVREVAVGNARAGLDRSPRVEHPRRLDQERGRRTRGRLRVHNLHVVNYIAPIQAPRALQELRRHLHTLPDHPDWIPYRTSYYTEDWGFCVTHRQFDALTEPDYEVCIDADLRDRLADLRRVRAAGRRRTRKCSSRRTSAIRRSPTTISRASRSPPRWPAPGAEARCATRTDFSSRPAPSGRSRGLPQHEQQTSRHRARPGARRRRRTRRPHLQAIPPRRRGRRSRDGARAAAGGRAARHRGLFALRPRRAAVLLARLRPAGGLPDARAVGHVPRVPHVGGLGRFSVRGQPRRVARRPASRSWT